MRHLEHRKTCATLFHIVLARCIFTILTVFCIEYQYRVRLFMISEEFHSDKDVDVVIKRLNLSHIQFSIRTEYCILYKNYLIE